MVLYHRDSHPWSHSESGGLERAMYPVVDEMDIDFGTEAEDGMLRFPGIYLLCSDTMQIHHLDGRRLQMAYPHHD
jgi:hypothetical protein